MVNTSIVALLEEPAMSLQLNPTKPSPALFTTAPVKFGCNTGSPLTVSFVLSYFSLKPNAATSSYALNETFATTFEPSDWYSADTVIVGSMYVANTVVGNSVHSRQITHIDDKIRFFIFLTILSSYIFSYMSFRLPASRCFIHSASVALTLPFPLTSPRIN